MSFDLFRTDAAIHVDADGNPVQNPRHILDLRVTLDELDDLGQIDKSIVTFRVGNNRADFKLTEDHTLSIDTMTLETIELKIDLSKQVAGDHVPNNTTAKAMLAKAGIVGFDMAVAAELKSVRITLRPQSPKGGWDARTPFFALTACWELSASAAANTKVINNENDSLTVDENATVTATAEACAGFACVRPPSLPPLNIDIDIDHLLIRFDLSSFAIGTGWLPLGMIDVTGLSRFHIDGFARWFAELVGVPNLDLGNVDLPDWTLDLPSKIDLPFGLGLSETELSLTRTDGKYTVTARLEGLEFSWNNQPVVPWSEFRAIIKLDEFGNYEIDLRLVAAHYPAKIEEKNTKYKFLSSPFGALELSAECWRLRVGLHSGGNASDLERVCIDFLLEIGGLEIHSKLTGGDSKPLIQTDLRLHMRNFSILMEDPGGLLKPKPFFDGIDDPEVKDVFEKFTIEYNKATDLKDTFTFARDLGAAPSNAPANDYGLKFIAGDLRKGERLYLAWSQVGTRLLDALSHDLFATPPAGTLPDAAAKTFLGLEIAWFEGDETQIRLDWLDGKTPLLRRKPEKQAEWTQLANVGYEMIGGDWKDSIPLPAGHKRVGVAIAPFVAQAQPIRISLPGIRFDFARPNARSIILHRAGNVDSVSYMFIYDTPTGDKQYTAQVARAEIGFSLTDSENGDREVLKDSKSEEDAFLTLAAGHARDTTTAIRVLGWQEGQGLRFGDALAADATPPKVLAIEKPPTSVWHNGCPVPPPPPQPVVPMRYGDFETPQFKRDAWQYALKFGALDKIMDLFKGDGDSTSPVKLNITRLIYEQAKNDSIQSDNVLIETTLELDLPSLGSDPIKGSMTFRFDPADGALSIEEGAELTLTQEQAEAPSWLEDVPLPVVAKGKKRVWAKGIDIHNLRGHLYADFDEDRVPAADEPLSLLTFTFNKGRISVGLAEEADLILRYEGFGRDGLSFLVEDFDWGPGGLNLKAGLILSKLRVRGLDAPFILEQAALKITNDELEFLTVSASGTLPRILEREKLTLTVTFKQDKKKSIELDELVCALGRGKKPIFSRGTRFMFEIDALELRYGGEGINRNFFFEISGAAQFTPDEGEFADGLLENLKSVRCEFVKAPLSDDFIDSLQFSVELNEPVSFDMYNLFRMEIRSIGFDPRFDGFVEPGPAIIIGGQCEFAALGDVVSAEIDFHACRVGFAKKDDPLPQIHFDGLRVDISSPEGFRIAGQVKRYETDLMRGFAGEGTVAIPGFPELSAAFSFVRLRSDEKSEWKHAWFVAIEASKFSVQIAPLPLHLRQVGLGFGYRYTLPLIKTFEDDSIKTLEDLIDRMLLALDRHQTLARIDSWQPDPEQAGRSALWTVALEAVFTVGTQQAGFYDYDPKKEQQLKTLVGQVIAAIRSDFTLVAAAKIWFPVSVDDFFQDAEGMRNRPLVRGFMIYSAPQRRFLAHAAKHDNPYLGKENEPWPKEVQSLFRNSHFEATLLIEPGLLHCELGWPDRLMIRWKIGSLEIEIRAGVLMRIENDAVVQGIYLSARGGMDLKGGINLGFTGVRMTARVDVFFATRLMTALYLSRPLDSKIYAEIGLDLSVRFTVEAWLRLKLGFVKINFNITFSFSIQIVVGLQMGWNGIGDLGFKGRATLVINVFGRHLRAGIAVGINDGAVDGARAAMLPYMSSFLSPGEPPRVPDGNLLNDRSSPKAQAETFNLLSMPGEAFAPAQSEGDFLTIKSKTTPDERKVQVEDSFVLTQVPGQYEGRDVTFVWIMPGPNQQTFYPVPKEKYKPVPDEEFIGWKKYAKLTNVPGAFKYNYNSADPKFDQDVESNPYLYINLNSTTVYESEKENTAQDNLSVRQLLASCYTLKPDEMATWLEAEKDRSFPEDYTADTPIMMPVDVPFESRMLDTRLQEGDQALRNPKRELDPDNPYDRALMDAIAQADARRRDPKEALAEQAFGMQSFLLQCFYDDLILLANEGPKAVLKTKGRPTILDLGLVVMVEEQQEWVVKRTLENSNIGTAPTLEFVKDQYAQPGADPSKPHILRPVVDFTELNFETFPPVLDTPVSFQDEEILAIGWQLRWGGQTPKQAQGADTDPEAYLKCYHLKIVDDTNRRTLLERTVKPCDLIGARVGVDKDARLQRLGPRYQFTVPMADLLGDEARGGQFLRSLSVTVTPEDQCGNKSSNGFTFSTSVEPTLKPLSADKAECRLKLVEADDPAIDGKPIAVLEWIEPALPDHPGVAGTDKWQLILRSLQQVPMGAYPEDAVEAEERGLMSVTGQDLQDGDLVVHLEVEQKMGLDGAPLSERRFQIELSPFAAPDDLKAFNVTDRDGNSVEAGHPSHDAWIAFCNGDSGNATTGRAWRLFLRAVHQPGIKHDPTYSSLSVVRLTAELGYDSSEELMQPDDGMPPLRARPLPHFEWPHTSDIAQQVVADPQAEAGRLHVPVITKKGNLNYLPAPSRERVISVNWPAMGDAGRESYAATAEFAVYSTDLDQLINADVALRMDSDFSRVLHRLITTGVSKTDPWQISFGTLYELSQPQQSYSTFETELRSVIASNDLPDFGLEEIKISEAPALKASRDRSRDIGAEWKKVAFALPADRRETAESPDTFNDAQNWQSWTPTFAAARRWQLEHNVSDDDVLAQWPGWYSWAESYLKWPDPMDEFADELEAVMERSTLSPGEIAAHPEAPKASLLAAWYALGQQEAGRRTHPWLALIIGWIAGQRMALISNADLADTGVDQVQVNTGQPVLERAPEMWLSANTATADPVARDALGHLGLALTLSLRDPVSGLSRPQKRINKRIEKAIKVLNETIGEIQRSASSVLGELTSINKSWKDGNHAALLENKLKSIEALVALPSNAIKELRLLEANVLPMAVTDRPEIALKGAEQDLRSIFLAADKFAISAPELKNHLAIDAPIQAQWARRAEPDNPTLTDASLRMLHISLRPIPSLMGKRLVATVVINKNHLYNDGVESEPIFAPNPLRIIWCNRGRAPRTIQEGERLSDVLEIDDQIFALAVQAENGSDVAPRLPDYWLEQKITKTHAAPVSISNTRTLNGSEKLTSPFGQFSVAPEHLLADWPKTGDVEKLKVNAVSQKAASVHFARSLSYLFRAFAPSLIANPDLSERREMLVKLLNPDEQTKAIQPFLTWSERFFATAPLTGLVKDEPPWLSNVDFKTTVSAPKSLAPLRVAANSAGRMEIALPVEEEWAATRSYAVLAHDRYARLRRSMRDADVGGADETGMSVARRAQMMHPNNRADIQLPRIRKMEPPQLLGQRIEILDGYPYHLLSVARHTEEWLSNATLPLRRKIEFGATTRTYLRKPTDWLNKWNEQLERKEWIPAKACVPKSDPNRDADTVTDIMWPDLSEARLMHLATVPKLRLGGDVHITSADPFWYTSQVKLSAYAGATNADERIVDLTMATPFETLSHNGNPVTISGLRADWPKLSDFGDRIINRLRGWGVNVPANIAEYFDPQGRAVCVRLPRLIESLPKQSVRAGGLYVAESTKGTLGTLPDPNISLDLTQERLGSESALMRIIAQTDAKADYPYSITMLDETLLDVANYLSYDASENWSDGFYLNFPLRRQDATALGESHLPENLTETMEEYPQETFPAIGGMMQLLPILARLHETNDPSPILNYTDPLHAPAWLCQPHLDPSDPRAMTEPLLMQGFKLILERSRRHAAGWLSADILTIQDDSAASILYREILRNVTEARITHLGPIQPIIDFSEIGSAGGLSEFGIFLWLRKVEGSQLTWEPYGNGIPTPGENMQILVTAKPIVRRVQADGTPEPDASVELRERAQSDQLYRIWSAIEPRAQFSADIVLNRASQVHVLAVQLAKRGFQPEPIPTAKVFVQRGNEPRQLWQAPPSDAPVGDGAKDENFADPTETVDFGDAP